jgi:hypothetical protein
MTDSRPAAIAQTNTLLGTAFARRSRRRACDVVDGAHRPCRYCQVTQSTPAIARAAHGTAGVVARFATTSPDQMPPTTSVRRKARTPVPITVRVVTGRGFGMTIQFWITPVMHGWIPAGSVADWLRGAVA